MCMVLTDRRGSYDDRGGMGGGYDGGRGGYEDRRSGGGGYEDRRGGQQMGGDRRSLMEGQGPQRGGGGGYDRGAGGDLFSRRDAGGPKPA